MSCCDYSHFAAGKVEAGVKLVRSLSNDFLFSLNTLLGLLGLLCPSV